VYTRRQTCTLSKKIRFLDRFREYGDIFASPRRRPWPNKEDRQSRKSRFDLIGKPMTSDHRVAGSSPAEYKSSLVKDWQAVGHCKNDGLKSVVIRLLSGFPVLLAFLTAHVRITPSIFSLLIW
jgi:hypothetical protein